MQSMMQPAAGGSIRGDTIDGKTRLKLQVNSEATDSVLPDFLREQGAHAVLASTDYEQNAEDHAEDLEKACAEPKAEAKKKLGEVDLLSTAFLTSVCTTALAPRTLKGRSQQENDSAPHSTAYGWTIIRRYEA